MDDSFVDFVNSLRALNMPRKIQPNAQQIFRTCAVRQPQTSLSG